jgi:acetate kinase
MDAILVVNAGSSSVKFQIFESSAPDAPRRLLKGQVDGIGARPRLRAEASDGSPVVDQSYAATEVADVPTATAVAAEWLRQTPGIELIAVGHRVVHGGPDYDRPVLIDKNVLARLERYVALAPLHQPNNLARPARFLSSELRCTHKKSRENHIA